MIIERIIIVIPSPSRTLGRLHFHWLVMIKEVFAFSLNVLGGHFYEILSAAGFFSGFNIFTVEDNISGDHIGTIVSSLSKLFMLYFGLNTAFEYQ